MKYTKYEMGSYHLHTIKTDKFKTIQIKINFKREVEKEEITIRNLLSDILIRSTSKYNSERLMSIATEELYGMNYMSNTTISGRYNIMSFEFSFLHEKYTEEGIFDSSFDFISNVLFEPNVTNKKFDTINFKQAKETLKQIIESIKENPKIYSLSRLFEEIDKSKPLSYRSDGYIEDLEKITESSLYNYYETLLKKDIIDIFIIGDIEEEKVKKIIQNRFKIHTFKKTPKSHFITDNKVRFRSQFKTDKGNYNQSTLMMGYNIHDINSFERNYVSYIYSSILGGGGDSKLFQNLREKHSLCYIIASRVFRLNNLLVIEAGIDKENQKKAIALVKKEVKEMVQGKFTDEDVMKAQVNYISGLKEILDSPSGILNMYIAKEYLDLELVDDRIEQIGKVDKNAVIDFAKKIKLNTAYLLEGDMNYEENTTT